MKLTGYIQGDRRGRDAHELERRAMEDPFLAEALEGYDEVGGDHTDAIKRLRARIPRNSRPVRRHTFSLHPWIAAASLLLFLAAGSYFFFIRRPPAQLAVESAGPVADTAAAVLADNFPKQKESAPEIYDEKQALPEKAERTPPQKVMPEQTELPEQAEQAERKAVLEDNEITRKTDAAYEKEADTPSVRDDTTDRIVVIAYGMASAKSRTGGITAASDSQAQAIPAEIVIRNLSSIRDSLTGKVAGIRSADPDISKPRPVDGMKDFRNYIKNTLASRADSLCMDKKGSVTLRFTVGPDGSPADIEVIKSLCPPCDSLAVELLRQGPKWTPASGRGEAAIRF